MRRCDICQGIGKITVVKQIRRIMGFTFNPDGKSGGLDFEAETVQEKCPQCDGKGLIK